MVDSPRVLWSRRLGEFITIVVGVLVALAVDEWAADRRDRVAESDIIDRLESDLRLDTAEFAYVLHRRETFEEGAQATLSFLRSGQLLDSGYPALLIHAVNAALSRSPVIVSPTYEELISTGTLRLIQDSDLREQLTRYHGQVRFGQVVIGELDAEYSRYVRQRVPAEVVRYIATACAAANGGARSCDPEVLDLDIASFLEEMRENPAVRMALNLRLEELTFARRIVGARLANARETLRLLEAWPGG